MAKETQDPQEPQNKDTIRKIWLAGIGAYGRALTEAKGAVDSLTGKGSEVFDELVQKGEVLEAVGKYKAEELLGKGKAAVPDFELDDRIAKMRARLSGLGSNESGDDRLASRVDAMEAKLDAILEKLDIGDAASKKSASVRKKAPARKTPKAASKTRIKTDKTPKPKPVAKEDAPKKGPTKKT